MRQFLPSFGFVCLLVVSSAGQQCTKAPIKTNKFVPMETPYTGCNDSLPTYLTKSKLGCSVLCLKTKNCVAFGYDSSANLCRVCAMNTQGSLYDTSKASTSTFYTLSQGLSKKGPTTVIPLNMQIDVGCGVIVGKMVVLRGIMTSMDGFKLLMRQDDKNIPLSLVSDYAGIISTGPIRYDQMLKLSSMVNNNYVGKKNIAFDPFLFPVNSEFELCILVRGSDYAFFVNGTYTFNYTYVLHPENTQSIELADNLKFIELSL